jgi:hypothetical protein
VTYRYIGSDPYEVQTQQVRGATQTHARVLFNRRMVSSEEQVEIISVEEVK